MSEYISSYATMSDCGLYRYMLQRTWDRFRDLSMTFVMLNPSTADGQADDATIRRCRWFAHSNGCGSMMIVNLFALRSKNPKRLVDAVDPIGPDNDSWIRAGVRDADIVVLGWGAKAGLKDRDLQVVKMLKERGVQLMCLGLTHDQFPRHHLYLANAVELEPYTGRGT